MPHAADPRPAAFAGALRDELAWTFSLPMGWLQGVAFNAALAASYLVFWPLVASEHYDIVLLFTVYFATFIMADVTTTNVFGHDVLRTVRALDDGRGFASILAIKNVVQVIVVVIPLMIITLGVTIAIEGTGNLVLTLPGILYPMLLWLGVGNVLTVLAPALPAPVKWRLANIRGGRWRMHIAMLVAYGIPYFLYYAAAASDLPGNLNALFGLIVGTNAAKWQSGAMLLGASVVIYLVLTWLAVAMHRRYGLVLRWQRELVESAPMDEDVRQAARRLLPPLRTPASRARPTGRRSRSSARESA